MVENEMFIYLNTQNIMKSRCWVCIWCCFCISVSFNHYSRGSFLSSLSYLHSSTISVLPWVSDACLYLFLIEETITAMRTKDQWFITGVNDDCRKARLQITYTH